MRRTPFQIVRTKLAVHRVYFNASIPNELLNKGNMLFCKEVYRNGLIIQNSLVWFKHITGTVYKVCLPGTVLLTK